MGDRCVMCDGYVPEGSMVCINCLINNTKTENRKEIYNEKE